MLVKPFELALDAVDRPVGAVEVRDEPAKARPVTDPAKPQGKHEQRLVAAAEARHEDHGTTVAPRQAVAPEDRVEEQPVELELPARLAHGVAPPAL